jgi:SAM-dependent methyltransferase
MRTELLPLLRDPVTGAPLELEATETVDDHVITGQLSAGGEHPHAVTGGVPRLVPGAAGSPDAAAVSGIDGGDQSATNRTFSDKWERFTEYGFEAGHREFLHGWFAKKFGLASPDDLPAFYAGFKDVLEIGPGSGFNTEFMARHVTGRVVSVDVSDGASNTTYRNTRDIPNIDVIQGDVNALPLPDDHFDFAIADGVLHHTPDTRRAVEALYAKVRPGGRMFFYVYRRMGAARYFADRHIREAFSPLEPEACYEACAGITELGRELSRLNATITLEHGIPILGIPPGTHDVQRLLYYNFLKCFWNEAFDWETNNMVNYDWYHPHDAWQHTEEEVAGWLDALGATYAFHPANPNGISALVTKPA